jgi:hypothetical protein
MKSSKGTVTNSTQFTQLGVFYQSDGAADFFHCNLNPDWVRTGLNFGVYAFATASRHLRHLPFPVKARTEYRILLVQASPKTESWLTRLEPHWQFSQLLTYA